MTARTPLFIVGIQRSGTSLVREVLRNHPLIALTHAETNLLPALARKLERTKPLHTQSDFSQISRWTRRFPYFRHLESKEIEFTNEAWFGACERLDAAGIFEAMARLDAGEVSETHRVWGDKSPAYRTELPLLARLFPGAHVLHVIRDVRDVCLSAQRAWGAHPLRTAQTWANDIEACRADSAELGDGHYLEVHYEALLHNPKHEFSTICQFLDLEFSQDMLNLSNPVDPLGQTANAQEIVTHNRDHWKEAFSSDTRAQIENIAGTAMNTCGYPLEFGEAKAAPLSPAHLGALRVRDGLYLLNHRRSRWGLLSALQRTAHAAFQ
ncbi:MAG: sulfotransferase [Myxococcota bacterium]|nr:sulfotransferase [Myxococcota bacterium]